MWGDDVVLQHAWRDGESKIEDRERGPEFRKAGNKPALRLVLEDE